MNKKKILILSDPRSSHTIKWCNGIASENYEVMLFGFSEPDYSQYSKDIKHNFVKINENLIKQPDGMINKASYLKSLPRLKKLIKEFNPDILHAQYASSYGFLGALCNFKPYVVSVWGDDIFVFPKKNFLFKAVMKYILNSANEICATSLYLKNETLNYTSSNINIIPFGIDEKYFKLKPKSTNPEEITIGIVKNLESKYGIENLIYAFKEVLNLVNSKKLKLIIAGDGTLSNRVIKLSEELGLAEHIKLLGSVPHSIIHEVHQKIDIAVYPSVQEGETFGVSIIESSACGVPVIASRIGGIPEVVIDGQTGFLVSPGSIKQIVEKMLILIEDDKLRNKMGGAGREFVTSNYLFKNNLAQLLRIYKNVS